VARERKSVGYRASSCVRTSAHGDIDNGTTTAAPGIPAVCGTTLNETLGEANTRTRGGDHIGAADARGRRPRAKVVLLPRDVEQSEGL
jgi:hypothetical protein